MRRDVLIRSDGVAMIWSNEYHTGLAQGASLISMEDWEKLLPAIGGNEFSAEEVAYITEIGMIPAKDAIDAAIDADGAVAVSFVAHEGTGQIRE